jgi:hypothetical protein
MGETQSKEAHLMYAIEDLIDAKIQLALNALKSGRVNLDDISRVEILRQDLQEEIKCALS